MVDALDAQSATPVDGLDAQSATPVEQTAELPPLEIVVAEAQSETAPLRLDEEPERKS